MLVGVIVAQRKIALRKLLYSTNYIFWKLQFASMDLTKTQEIPAYNVRTKRECKVIPVIKQWVHFSE
jgi:hypothetical protein